MTRLRDYLMFKSIDCLTHLQTLARSSSLKANSCSWKVWVYFCRGLAQRPSSATSHSAVVWSARVHAEKIHYYMSFVISNSIDSWKLWVYFCRGLAQRPSSVTSQSVAAWSARVHPEKIEYQFCDIRYYMIIDLHHE